MNVVPATGAGVLTFSNGGDGNDWINTGYINTNARSTVYFLAGSYTFNPNGAVVCDGNQMAGDGSYQFWDGSNLIIPQGATTAAGSVTVLAGARVSGAGNFSPMVLTWAGGSMEGAGVTDIKPAGELNITGEVTLDARQLRIRGQAEWDSPQIAMANGASVYVEGGSLDILANQATQVSAVANTTGGRIYIVNNGLVTKRPNIDEEDWDAVTTIRVPVDNQNSRFDAQGLVTLGNWFSQSGANAVSTFGDDTYDLRFFYLTGGAVRLGIGNYDMSSSYLNGGTLELNGGTLTPPDFDIAIQRYAALGANWRPMASMTLNLVGSVGRLEAWNCTVYLIGDLSVTSDFRLGGGLSNWLSLQLHTLTVAGQFRSLGTVSLESGSIIAGSLSIDTATINGPGWINDTFYDVA
jgi:hypothetical protein